MRSALALGLVFFSTVANAGDREELRELRERVERQEAIIMELLRKVDALEAASSTATNAPAEAPPVAGTAPPRVNLDPVDAQSGSAESGSEESPERSAPNQHVLARPWYENFHVSGFAGAGYVDTGSQGTHGDGGFLNYQAQVWVDAQVWDDIDVFHELRFIRVGDEDNSNVEIGELYVRFRDPLRTLLGIPDSGVGAKFGRMDIPFGEDYLTQDLVDNPLISLSAAWPYGLDEGVVLYGENFGIGWNFAVMDGSNTGGVDDDSDKFVSLKIFGNVTEKLYLSASAFRNGDSSKSAWEFAGSHIEPVGADDRVSTMGVSGSRKVNSYSYELDARYDFADGRHLKLQFGSLVLDDDESKFERTIYYGQVEPVWNLGPRFGNRLYVAARLSGIGTYDDDEGYSFDGKPFAGGADAFGYDTKSLYRAALALGYRPVPRLVLKLEYSHDDFRTIDGSPLRDGGSGSDLFGGLFAAEF